MVTLKKALHLQGITWVATHIPRILSSMKLIISPKLKRILSYYLKIGYYRKDLMPILSKLDIRETNEKGKIYYYEGIYLQQLADKVSRQGMNICEIGSWKGWSTAHLAQVAQENNGIVDCVDTWKGSNGYQGKGQVHQEGLVIDILRIFRGNMETLGFGKIVQPFPCKSLEAVDYFHDGEFDLIYIDADHNYQSIYADIMAWLPKVRSGGILCGHDCEVKYSQLSPAIRRSLNDNINDGKDFMMPEGFHTGVIKALWDIFQDDYKLLPNSRIWYIEVK